MLTQPSITYQTDEIRSHKLQYNPTHTDFSQPLEKESSSFSTAVLNSALILLGFLWWIPPQTDQILNVFAPTYVSRSEPRKFRRQRAENRRPEGKGQRSDGRRQTSGAEISTQRNFRPAENRELPTLRLDFP